jgi:hypothetical protein
LVGFSFFFCFLLFPSCFFCSFHFFLRFFSFRARGFRIDFFFVFVFSFVSFLFSFFPSVGTFALSFVSSFRFFPSVSFILVFCLIFFVSFIFSFHFSFVFSFFVLAVFISSPSARGFFLFFCPSQSYTKLK